MAILKLVGFAVKGFSSHRETVTRFINQDATWGDVKNISDDICWELSCFEDPYLTVQDLTEKVDRLQVFDSAEEEWRYAVQSGQTELGYKEWRNVAYTAPMVIFEVCEIHPTRLVEPTHSDPEVE